MKRTSSTQQWAQRRTEVLLGLFKTQAPPDFRAQVLMRLQERQHAAATPCTLPACSAKGWRRLWLRLWEATRRQSHDVTLIMVASRACILVFAVALLCWAQLQHHAQPALPLRHASSTDVLSTGTARSIRYESFAGAIVAQDRPLFVTPPDADEEAAPLGIFSQPAAPSKGTDETTLEAQPRVLPRASQPLPSSPDPPPVMKTEPQRLYAQRVVPAR